MGEFELKVAIAGQGYPILCLHGHPGSGRSMRVFTEHLAQNFQTLSPDLRGYGQSKTRQDFTMTDHLSDLERLLDRYSLDRCLLLGWSLGGILALELAVKHPERFSGLILVATAGRPWSNHPPVSLQDNVYTGIAAMLNLVKPGWEWNIETFAKRSLFRYLIQQHTPAAYHYIASDAVYAFANTSPAANRALTQAMREGYTHVQGYEKIGCPCLMLAGEADRHISAISSLETADAIPNCESKVYPNTAHLLPWEIPAQLLSDIDQWLAQHPETVAAKRNNAGGTAEPSAG
ncbi:alpha/beta fold hydrolase [Myxacorys almedinensis A]|uniref:Alpha/beta fold hydrolase n=2 Tax=Myxacorys TaxID=2056239 RepID=A0A8J7Z2F0_9CYAN|nr:alpha/beta hydrolase [Myxacorys almedinensis]NDJ16556.1 alpha/beta fold hydrolase [Myxacorys almedinensis A]